MCVVFSWEPEPQEGHFLKPIIRRISPRLVLQPGADLISESCLTQERCLHCNAEMRGERRAAKTILSSHPNPRGLDSSSYHDSEASDRKSQDINPLYCKTTREVSQPMFESLTHSIALISRSFAQRLHACGSHLESHGESWLLLFFPGEEKGVCVDASIISSSELISRGCFLERWCLLVQQVMFLLCFFFKTFIFSND